MINPDTNQDEDGFCDCCGVPIGDDHDGDCDNVKNGTAPLLLWHVSLWYQTESGNEGAWTGELDAADSEEAYRLASDKVRADKRRHVLKIHEGSIMPAVRLPI